MTCAVCGFVISLTTISVTIDGEHAFAADQHGEQIEAGRIGHERAEFNDIAIDGHRAPAQHVMTREGPYLRQCTTMHAARILSLTLPPMVHAICDDGSGE